MSSPDNGGIAVNGLTLRDWFAGQVVAGLGGLPEDRARFAYETADAMMRERARPAPPLAEVNSTPPTE